jgi:hypothetical protein
MSRLACVTDARELAGFLRTDHAHLMALEPTSEAAQELKLLTEDYQRQVRTQTRLVNQLTATLKAYYPRALDVAELTTALAPAFLQAYPTPATLTTLTGRQWQRRGKAHHLSEARTMELWTSPDRPEAALESECSKRPFCFYGVSDDLRDLNPERREAGQMRRATILVVMLVAVLVPLTGVGHAMS